LACLTCTTSAFILYQRFSYFICYEFFIDFHMEVSYKVAYGVPPRFARVAEEVGCCCGVRVQRTIPVYHHIFVCMVWGFNGWYTILKNAEYLGITDISLSHSFLVSGKSAVFILCLSSIKLKYFSQNKDIV